MAKRDYYFDNAKFLLIFLVVFGHLIQSYIDSNTFFSTLYKLLYTFHMPAFILISGYFAKGIYEKGYIMKITKKLIIPYLIFQVIYSVFYYVIYSKSMLTIDFLNPHWSLWFLISLFCWNIMLIGFNKMKPVYAVSLALFIGLIVGYVDWISNYLSLSRTFVFFPFFIVGYFIKKEHFHLLSESKTKVLMAGAILIVTLVIIIFPELDEKWLLGSKPYSYLETFSTIGFIKRIGIYTINFLMVASFFAFVPRRKFFFTKLGRNTLYVYLLHGFIVRAFRGSTIESYLYDSKTIIILLIVSLLLTFLLSSKIVTTATQPIIELKWSRWKRTFGKFKENIGEPRGQSE
ncbi:acyltransferase family protein [Lederbergia wuyishanensis]|uniref:Fucose 4-O-acetylase-like acetyltransferase n=1 Tax=Lederbergia wuyishanensis TaxID=1347903 RepID=A0ABU0CZ46_9BACI|nr:acyltransferase family protein [Lederbergia wuyishanensis]MCJ8006060.1 acyltransferase family protein [Lederbergia wuyishanensis]MDQ0341429.1 fucose 4-O-acetylase-like acetyltransferase [Lederbergia wuyishanensis]